MKFLKVTASLFLMLILASTASNTLAQAKSNQKTVSQILSKNYHYNYHYFYHYPYFLHMSGWLNNDINDQNTSLKAQLAHIPKISEIAVKLKNL